MMYSIETDNKARVRRDARGYEIKFGRVRLEISDWSDRQRELRAQLSSSPMTVGTSIRVRTVRTFLPSGIENLNSRTRVTKTPGTR